MQSPQLEGNEEDEYYDEDEEYEDSYKSSDESDKKEFGIYQCLPVDEVEPNWDLEEPDTVEEYLRRVRYEARTLPSVVTSTIDSEKLATPAKESPNRYSRSLEESEIPPCPEAYKPSIRWLREFLTKFAKLRRQLHREHQLLTGQVDGLPMRVTYTSALDESTQKELETLKSDSPSALMPELWDLKTADQLTIVRLTQEILRKTVSEGGMSTPDTAARIYALSARLEKPLHCDVGAAYRALLRCCAAQRAGISHSKDELLPHINILIAISGAYFGQDEELASLWEEDAYL